MELKKGEVYVLWKTLREITYDRANPKFTYALAKNIKAIEVIAIDIQTKMNPTEEFYAYDAKRVEIQAEYAVKNAEGKVIYTNNICEIPEESKEEFDAKLADLQVEYKDMFVEAEERKIEFDIFKEEVVEVPIHKVDVEVLPETINRDQMAILMDTMLD